jgi:hypothetical protein
MRLTRRVPPRRRHGGAALASGARQSFGDHCPMVYPWKRGKAERPA